MRTKGKRIAIVGAGVAGITAAYLLQNHNNVVLYEKNSYIGGHTNTLVVQDGVQHIPIDTGFIVLNDRTYPNFHKLLKKLDVQVRNSDMSFSYSSESENIHYAGTDINGILAQRSNLFRPSFWRMWYDLYRFNKQAQKDIETEAISSLSLEDYTKRLNLSTTFIKWYLQPMGAAIWSTPGNRMMQFPALTFLKFFQNHGLLSIKDIPQWQTVVGGSHSYVKAFLSHFNGRIVKDTAITQIQRNDESVIVEDQNGDKKSYDTVILATHADQALRLLSDPSEEEKKYLGAWSYTKNDVALHTDSSHMPSNKRAWASWNYVHHKSTKADEKLYVTYHMNRLQGLTCKQNYFVTLNPPSTIDEQKVIQHINYTHPLYTQAAIDSQPYLKKLNGIRNTFYCGSYFGFGFHEDAVKSGLEVARHFGEEL